MILFGFLLFVFQSFTTTAHAFTVTPGVEYKKGANAWKNKAQTIHTVEVDVSRPHVTVDAVIPNPLNARARLTNLLKNNSMEGNRMVAGINAAFFHTKSGAPAYLLSSNGQVNTYGVISTGNTEYMSIPTAFAMDKHGKGLIGQFGYDAKIQIGNTPISITNINKVREANDVILYTPSYSFESTRSNEYGMEVVVRNLSTPIEEKYALGTEVAGKVTAVAPYGSGNRIIPSDGVVISIQGGAQAALFKDVKVGDDVSLTVDLKEPWKDAKFMLASGPLLVQNGKVDMTINPKSSRAQSVHPRTAVAVNEDGSKVFLVTVDGRRAGSTGMNLTDFSEYLISIGAHYALNLDGGGSTTMAVRKRGDMYPTLFNQPSDNYERTISAAIGAVSLAPTGPAKSMEATLKGPSVLQVGGTTAIEVKSGLDVNFNRVPVHASALSYSVQGDIGEISSTGVFKATKSGKGTIHVRFGEATLSYAIEVLPEPKGGQLIHSFESASMWTTDAVRANIALQFEGNRAPVKDGKTAMKLAYDFTAYKEGTSAAYAVAKTPIPMSVKPTYLGVWVFGDGNSHWLRGQVTDREGKKHTIDFTENGGLNWTGWKYVRAKMPKELGGPIALNRIYIAEPSSAKKNRGAIYIDRLIAEYGNDYQEPLFNDVPLNHRAAEEIAYAVENGWILGDIDGRFNPEHSISRAHAAVLMSRVLNLSAKNEPKFTDVPGTHRYAKEIAAIVEAGIMSGTSPTTFNPEGVLTRAQMAKVLVNSYHLTADPSAYDLLNDVPKSFWAFDDIHILRANNITIIEDGYYRPFEDVKRYQIAAFLTRIDKR